MNPQISVLMANYNHADLIGAAIASVQAQTISEWELVIVDDGSSDDSLSVIASVVAGDVRIRVESFQQNLGVGYAKKLCAQLAQAPLLTVLDPDDCLSANALEVLVTAHREQSGASLIWSNHHLCDERLQVVKTTSSSYSGDSVAGYLPHASGSIHHCWSFKKEFYDQTEGFSQDYPLAEDQDLFYKLEEVGSTYHVPDVLYYYRIHQGGISTGDKTAEAFGWHLLAMNEALRRRKKIWNPDRLRQTKRVVESRWKEFSAWGIPSVSKPLLRRLLMTAWRFNLPLGILWSCCREELRRRLRSI